MHNTWLIYLPFAIFLAVHLRGVYLYYAESASLRDLRISIGALGGFFLYFGACSYSIFEPSSRIPYPKIYGVTFCVIGLGILIYSFIAKRKTLDKDMEDISKSKWEQ